jgi:predicted dehydrogenase
VQSIRDAVTKAGVKTVTSVVLRWNPQFETVRQLIADGVLGDLVYGEAEYVHPLKAVYPGYWSFVSKDRGGSAFVCGGCHAVDILRWLGGEIVEVAAFSAGKKINMDFEYDPNVVASLKFANGAVGKLTTILDADTVHLQRACGTEEDHRQRGVLVEALPGKPRLLVVSDDQAGFRRGRAPPVQAGDRPLPRVRRDGSRVARVDRRQLEVDGRVLRHRRVGGERRPPGPGTAFVDIERAREETCGRR